MLRVPFPVEMQPHKCQKGQSKLFHDSKLFTLMPTVLLKSSCIRRIFLPLLFFLHNISSFFFTVMLLFILPLQTAFVIDCVKCKNNARTFYAGIITRNTMDIWFYSDILRRWIWCCLKTVLIENSIIIVWLIVVVVVVVVVFFLFWIRPTDLNHRIHRKFQSESLGPS